MDKKLVRKESEVLNLQNRVTELERQLAEAQATIRVLSSSEGEAPQNRSAQQRVEELNAIIQALHDPVMVYDQNGVVSMANSSAIQAHGFDPTGHHRRDTNQTLMVRYPNGERVHTDDLPSARALKGEIVIDEALIITNFQRQELSILVTSSPLLVNGVPKGAVSIWRDITAQKDAEKAKDLALAQAEEGRLLLEALLEFLPEGICITGGPPTFPIRRVSRYGLEMTGNPAAAVIGLPAGQHQYPLGLLAADGVTRLAPEETPLYRASHSGEITLNKEMMIQTQGGAQIPILMSAVPIRDAQGQIIAAINSWRDFTEIKQLEEDLRTTRDQAIWLARLPGENPNPVVRVSDADIILYHNPPAANLPGWACVLNEPLALPLRPLVQRALTEGRPIEQEFTLGAKIYSVSVAPVPRKGYANLYGRDITEQKKAEKALAESRQRFNDILGSLGDGLFALNREWAIIYINRQAAQIAGYSIDELVGKNLWELWPQLRGTSLEASYRQAMENGTPSQLRVQGSQSDRWYDVSVYPSSEGITVFYLDKTEQIQVEEALRESEERFAKAFHASPSALVISRQADGRIETVNDTFIEFFGYGKQEIIGKTSIELGMFVNPGDRQEAIHRLQNDKFVRDFELDVRLKSGEVRNVSLSIETINIGGENSMFTMMQDITQRKRAEEALRASEERYRAVVENALDAIVVTDPSQGGKVLSVNPAACRMFGYSMEEFLGLDRDAILDITDPRLTAFLERRQQQRQVTGQLTYKRKDGTRFSGELSSVFYTDGNGEQRAVAIIRDITDREQFEIALRKRESILAQAGEIAHLGAWDIEFHNRDNVNANPLAWSDEVYRIFGYTPGEVQPSNDLFFERVHPDDRVLVQESVAQAIATRQPYRIEHRIIRPNGEERIVQEHAEVFFDESGNPVHMIGAVQDITERKRAEAALRESEERFRSLADSMPQLVWTALPDGSVDYYNSRAQEYWGIKQVMATIWEWAPVLHPEDLQATVSAWRHSVETGEIYQTEHRVRMADGSYRWHLSRGVPMRAEKGQVIRWFGTATDIHDLKLTEEQAKIYAERLEHSNRELEQFAFMASHDLQEPLRKIEVFGDLLLERALSLSGRDRNYLDRMRDAASRMRGMVEGLLQLSRVTTQGKPFIPVNLTQVISEVLRDLEDQIRRTGGKVGIEPLPAIEGDPLQLRQLMQNLIGNALKYHLPELAPEVKVYTKQFSGKVQIFVEDKGIGFNQEDAERVFQPFQRLVGRSQYEGSGIGLAICRRIVERHSGEITAVSQPGSGATFIVTLPMYQPENVRKQERI